MSNYRTENINRWLFNPFIYVAGQQALFIGGAAMLAASVISYLSKTHFDGAIDVHFGAPGSYPLYVVEQLVAWGSTSAVFYVLGLIFSKSRIRLVDVAGTIAMARVITLPIAFLGFIPIWQADLGSKLLLGAVIIMIPAIWMIALMFNAFSISTNIRSTKAIICFIAGLLIAEISSKALIDYLSTHL